MSEQPTDLQPTVDPQAPAEPQGEPTPQAPEEPTVTPDPSPGETPENRPEQPPEAQLVQQLQGQKLHPTAMTSDRRMIAEGQVDTRLLHTKDSIFENLYYMAKEGILEVADWAKDVGESLPEAWASGDLGTAVWAALMEIGNSIAHLSAGTGQIVFGGTQMAVGALKGDKGAVERGSKIFHAKLPDEIVSAPAQPKTEAGKLTKDITEFFLTFASIASKVEALGVVGGTAADMIASGLAVAFLSNEREDELIDKAKETFGDAYPELVKVLEATNEEFPQAFARFFGFLEGAATAGVIKGLSEGAKAVVKKTLKSTLRAWRALRHSKRIVGESPRPLTDPSVGPGAKIFGDPEAPHVTVETAKPVKPSKLVVDATKELVSLKKTLKKLSPSQVEQALRNYTDNSWTNRVLRSRDPAKALRNNPEAARIINGIDTAFESAEPLAQPMKVYRGTRIPLPKDKLKPGERLIDLGHVSTTLKHETAGHFIDATPADGKSRVAIEFLLPAGFRALDLRGISRFKESEFLLPRGLQYEIVEVKPYPDDWYWAGKNAGAPKPDAVVTVKPVAGEQKTGGVPLPMSETALPFLMVEPKGGFGKYVVNINLERIDSSTEVKTAIGRVAQAFEKDLKAIRELKDPKEQAKYIKVFADDLGVDEKALKKKFSIGSSGDLDIVKIAAARQLLVSSASLLRELALTAVEKGDEASLARLQRAVAVHALIEAEIVGKASTAGRALAIFGKTAQSSELLKRQIRDFIDASGGAEHIKNIAKAILQTPEDSLRGINDIARRSFFARWFDRAMYLMRANLLSKPTLQALNVTSGFMLTAWEAAVSGTAAGVSTFGRGVRRLTGAELGLGDVQLAEGIGQLTGMFKGFERGLVLADRAAKTGLPQLEPNVSKVVAMDKANFIGGPNILRNGPLSPMARAWALLAKIIDAPYRGLLIGDELVKGTAAESFIYGAAMKEAAKRGLRGEEAQKFVAEFIARPPENVVTGSLDFARRVALQDRIDRELPFFKLGAALTDTLAKVPGLRALVPFTNIVINATRYSFENSLYAPLVAQWRREFAAGGDRRAKAVARLLLGSMLAGWAVQLALEGKITGPGPADPGEREVWKQTHQPYSFHFNGRWLSYEKYDLFRMIFAGAAAYADLVEHFDDRTLGESAMALAFYAYSIVLDKSAWQGVFDFANMLTDAGRGATASAVAQPVVSTALNFVPGTVLGKMIGDMQDPYARSTRGSPERPVISRNIDPREQILWDFFARLRAATPPFVGDIGDFFGLDIPTREDLPIKYNVLGEPVASTGSGRPVYDPLARSIRLVGGAMKPEYSRVAEILNKYQLKVTPPSRVIDGIRLPESLYQQYRKVGGAAFRRNLARLFRTQEWRDAVASGNRLHMQALVRRAYTLGYKEGRGKVVFTNQAFQAARKRLKKIEKGIINP